MREQSPQPKRSLYGPQISTLIRTFSCFFKPKITCKVLMREQLPQPKQGFAARK